MGWCYLLGWFIFGLGIGANAKHSEMEGSFCKSCPYGWTWYGGRCYVFVNNKMDWAAAEDKAWFWSDGGPFDFGGWCPGEPNTNGGQDHCMEINKNGKDCATAAKCSKSKDFVCAKDCPCPS